MPGVGVAPGFIFRFANLGSGIPGVGVAPFGTEFIAFAGIPGVMFADGGIGDVENSGGRFALLLAFAFIRIMFVFEFEFDCGAEPHANTRQETTSKAANENILYIKTKPQN